jgi:effector-binding domain-containing protein
MGNACVYCGNVVKQGNDNNSFVKSLESIFKLLSKYNIFNNEYINTIFQNLNSGNFNSISEITKNINQTVTSISIPYTTGKNVIIHLIYDSSTNTYFFEIPSELTANNSKNSIAYIIQPDGTINGKFLLADGKEIPFNTSSKDASPNETFIQFLGG